MALDTTISLTTLAEVKSLIGTPEVDGMWIYYSGSNATATVEVTDSTQ